MVSNILGRKATVYWSASCMSQRSAVDLLVEEPKNLLKDISSKLPNSGVNMCPSFLNDMRNTYIVSAPCDFSVKYISAENKWHYIANQTSFGSDDAKDIITQFHGFIHYDFFTESQDTTMTLLAPSLHHVIAPYFGGSFDIDKWYRSVSAAYLLDKKKEYFFKEGSPLFYVKFNKPVKFVQFYVDPELAHITYKTMLMKDYVGTKPLTYLYNKFLRSRFNKRIANAIKNRIV